MVTNLTLAYQHPYKTASIFQPIGMTTRPLQPKNRLAQPGIALVPSTSYCLLISQSGPVSKQHTQNIIPLSLDNLIHIHVTCTYVPIANKTQTLMLFYLLPATHDPVGTTPFPRNPALKKHTRTTPLLPWINKQYQLFP